MDVSCWFAALCFVAILQFVFMKQLRENGYNLDNPKNIPGSKMWCYKLKRKVQTVIVRKRVCTRSSLCPSLGKSEACRNCSYVARQEKQLSLERDDGPPLLSKALASEYQNFSSPLYPENYPHNIECIWLFKPPSKQRRKLTITFLDINLEEESTDCKIFAQDFVQVRFVSRKKNPKIVYPNKVKKRRVFETRLCGSSLPRSYKDTRLAHAVEVVFRADSTYSSRGFTAVFQGFDETKSKTILRPEMGGTLLASNDLSFGLICSHNVTNGSGVISFIRSTTTETAILKVSTFKDMDDKRHVQIHTNRTKLSEAVQLYEEYDGDCYVNDPILKDVLESTASVDWHAVQWESATRITSNTTTPASTIDINNAQTTLSSGRTP